MKTHKMKNSGVKWIGMAPVEWDIKPIKYCIEHRQGGAWGEDEINEEQSGKENVICIRVADFDYQHFSVQTEKPYTLRSYDRLTINKLLLQNGDILVEKSGGGEKTPVGRAIIFDKPIKALYANFLERFRLVSNIVPQYFQYTWNSFYKLGHTRLYIKQTTGIQNLDFAKILSNEYILVPSVTEQIAIANFLDAKCAEIDSLTADIKNQIETLQEYKKSVITEAVTKGLNPNVEMKDSGVEWIGKIPQHWKVVPLKYLGLVRNGLTYKPTDLLDDGVPVLRSTNIQNGRLDLTDVVYVNNKLAQQYMLKKGDILVCSRNGSAKLIGKNAYIGESNSYAFGAFMMVFSSKLGEYGYYLLNSALFPYYKPLFTTSTINQLTGKQFGEMQVPLAPELEREIITKYLKEQVSCIEVSIEEKQKQLEVLAQYKQSLIYEYVTGKKSVPT